MPEKKRMDSYVFVSELLPLVVRIASFPINLFLVEVEFQ